MKVAALDLGSNTFLCLIAEVQDGKVVQVIDDQVEVVRLGQKVSETKTFQTEALLRAKACLQKFKKTIDQHCPQKILAMATSAARDVTNKSELLAIGNELGIPIEIIPGGKEAEITFFGAISGLQNKPKGHNLVGVLDIGGGSTEFIVGDFEKIHFACSIDVGCVRFTEKFISRHPISDEEFTLLNATIKAETASVIEKVKKQNILPSVLLAVAGTPTELAKIELGRFDADKIDGMKIDGGLIEKWLNTSKGHTPQELIEKFGATKGRADVFIVGLLILQEFLEQLKLESLVVSTRGVRFGVALEIEKRV